MGGPRYQQTPASAGRLFALSHDLMGALDLDGRLVWANPAWQAVLGRDPAELTGTAYLELLHPDDRERALAVQAELAAGTTARPELEVRLRTSDGDDRWILFNAVYSPDERLLYISGKDVTARAETALLHSRYRALVANLPDTVVTLFDPDLRIIVAEGAQLARRGLDADAYAGRPLAEAMPAEQFAKIAPRYRAALAGETPDLRRRHARRRGHLPRAGRPAPRRAGAPARRDVGQPRRHRVAPAGARDGVAHRRARALQRRARAVRLRRLARPLRAAADGLQLPAAAAPPLRRHARRGRRRLHRLRGRGRRAHAHADRGPARLLARRPLRAPDRARRHRARGRRGRRDAARARRRRAARDRVGRAADRRRRPGAARAAVPEPRRQRREVRRAGRARRAS